MQEPLIQRVFYTGRQRAVIGCRGIRRFVAVKYKNCDRGSGMSRVSRSRTADCVEFAAGCNVAVDICQ